MIRPLIPPEEFVGIDGIVHLCSGGEAPVLRSHLAALERFALDKGDGMTGRERMFETYRQAKRHLSSLLGRPEGEIALLGSASEGVNVVAQSLDWRNGDNVVVADLEYPSLIYPFTRLRSRGVELRVVPTRDWLIQLADLRDAVDDRTRLLAVSQVSYLTGQRLSLPAVADIAWSAGASLLVDATHALGVVPVDANLCDFLVSSCYKWLLAAHGIGVFVWNRARVSQLDPASLGWHSVSHRSGRSDPTEMLLRPDADRFEMGNPAFPSVYLLTNALQRLNRLNSASIETHAITLSGLVRDTLVEHGYSVTTPAAPTDRAGNVCFESHEAESIADALAKHRVLVWSSEGRIRVSTHVYNSDDDVQRLVTSLASLGR